MKVYLITGEETEGHCGFGCNFYPEAFTTKEKAEARHAHLQASRPPYSGVFYTLDEIELDYEDADY